MDAIARGYQAGNLAFLKAIERGLILVDKRRQLIPTNIAAVFLAAFILGILFCGLSEVELSRVNLVEHFLSGSFVVGIEQDVARFLCAVVVSGIHLGVLQKLFIGGIFRLGNLFLKSLLKHGNLKQRAILRLGGADLLQRIFPIFIGIVVRAHLLHLGIDFGRLDLNVVFLGSLANEFLARIIVDDFLANVGHGVIVVDKPLCPVGVGLKIRHAAEVCDVRRHGLLTDFRAIDRGSNAFGRIAHRHVAGIAFRLAAANGGKTACGGKCRSAGDFQEVHLLH